jgi:hypothetical protein
MRNKNGNRFSDIETKITPWGWCKRLETCRRSDSGTAYVKWCVLVGEIKWKVENIDVFCVDLRTNSINWLVFITETECVYCAVRSAHTVYLCVLCGSKSKQRLFHYTALTDWFYNRDGVCFLRGTFCPHSVFMCFVWIWEQTVIISLYS